jgi:hypothetical protein
MVGTANPQRLRHGRGHDRIEGSRNPAVPRDDMTVTIEVHGLTVAALQPALSTVDYTFV